MRYLIIDKDYCVFKAEFIDDKTREALKNGLVSIIDVRNMQGINISGCNFSPVQNWSIDMLDAKLAI